MKLAFVSTILGYPWGGADAAWTAAAEAALARGDQVLLALSALTAAHPRVAALVQAGATLVVRPPPAARPVFGRGHWHSLRRRLGAYSDPAVVAVGAFRPDLVLFSCGGTDDLVVEADWVAWLAASATRYRVVANWQAEHPATSPDHCALLRKLFLASDGVFFLSERNLAVTRRHLANALPDARAFQVPLRWQPADASPWPDASVLRFAAVARLEPVKGLDLLLPALHEALGSEPAWQLNLFGRGPDEAKLRALAARLGLADRVVFRGYVGGLREIWTENHLFVSPALDEGVPMTIPEAMLCGRPALATDLGGAPEWIRDGVTGFLCPVPTAAALEATLRTAWAARARWPAMGGAAAAAAKQRYLPEDFLRLIA
ncbi:MAG: glycosyltransferase family 4 protein [Opitutae bacterium]|nr:glycosyltransferase family 4 protein [Opitutae bacterium]